MFVGYCEGGRSVVRENLGGVVNQGESCQISEMPHSPNRLDDERPEFGAERSGITATPPNICLVLDRIENKN